MRYRPLANTGIEISEIALGCWPIAGMTSPGTSDADSLATVRACFDLGINHLDTAYAYGRSGESERLIARALGRRRGEMVIATKCGLHWDAAGQADARRPARHAAAAVRREPAAARDRPRRLALPPCARPENVPVAESAGELRRLMEEGKTLAVGASNLTLAQLEAVRRRLSPGRFPAALQHAHAADRGRRAALVPPSTAWRCWSIGR